uniref:Protein kinase domain-containing protein n=1 Tax=Steinernema glaseri TaxID=37863 RepID=A0A1I7YCN9_9BILA
MHRTHARILLLSQVLPTDPSSRVYCGDTTLGSVELQKPQEPNTACESTLMHGLIFCIVVLPFAYAHKIQDLPSVGKLLEDRPRPQYCEVGNCRNWNIIVLLSLSPVFPEAHFQDIVEFFRSALSECTNEHGRTRISFTSLNETEVTEWFSDLHFVQFLDFSSFVNERKPAPKAVFHRLLHLSTEMPKPREPHVGQLIVFISDYEVFFTIGDADKVRSSLIREQIRLKLLYFEDYFDDDDDKHRSSSDENYFEMIGENGEVVEVNTADNLLKNPKMMLKLYPCQSGFKEYGSLKIGSFPPEPPPPLPLWPFVVGGSCLLLLLIVPLAVFCFILGSVDMNEYIQIENKEWLIPAHNLAVDLGRKLGSGAFSSVYYGKLVGRAPVCEIHSNIVEGMSYTNCEVAVKVLPQFADAMAKSDFLQEVNLMKALAQHTHLLRMLGVCQKPETDVCLVLEFCKNGDLLKFVRQNQDAIRLGYAEHVNFKDLLGICWQIADGMYFLSTKDLVHRDLAARNIFLTENMTAKIGDFGLCRLTDSSIYQTRGGKMPVKWTAIESLKDFEHSSKSDVWSFGIVLFEVFSLGEVPYADISISDLLVFLEAEGRQKPPKNAPDEIASLMQCCWKANPSDRPSFKTLREQLATMLSNSTEHYGYVDPTYRARF